MHVLVVRGLNVLESGVAQAQGEAKGEPLSLQILDIHSHNFQRFSACMMDMIKIIVMVCGICATTPTKYRIVHCIEDFCGVL